MKKNMLNLIAVSMVALFAGGLKAAQCTAADNQSKKVTLVNNVQEDVRFMVMDSASPSTSGVMVTAREVIVPAGKTKQINYCNNGYTLMDITAMGPVNVSPTAEVVKIVKTGVVQGDGSYTAQDFVDIAGGSKLDFANLFNQLRNKNSGSVIITVGSSTAGLIAKAQVK